MAQRKRTAEEWREYMRQWYAKNRGRALAIAAKSRVKFHAAHPGLQAENARKWRRENPEKHRNYQRNWMRKRRAADAEKLTGYPCYEQSTGA